MVVSSEGEPVEPLAVGCLVPHAVQVADVTGVVPPAAPGDGRNTLVVNRHNSIFAFFIIKLDKKSRCWPYENIIDSRCKKNHVFWAHMV